MHIHVHFSVTFSPVRQFFLFLTNLRVTVNVNNCMLKAGRSLAMIPLDVVH